jgi:haloalkane dehalogenase
MLKHSLLAVVTLACVLHLQSPVQSAEEAKSAMTAAGEQGAGPREPAQNASNAATPKSLRTPEERFANLPDYPFAPHYHEWHGLRMHYVDEGSGPPIVMLHGQPTYSYLYRKFIPPLVAAGFRCIAPDYIGFGTSDKVVDDNWYSIQKHSDSVRSLLIDKLDLRNITLVVHDWGGPIGLPIAVELPDRFAGLFIFNTWLHHEGFDFSGMKRYRDFAVKFPPGTGDIPIMPMMLSMPAYRAPFPDASYKAGPRRFPYSHPYAEPELGNKAVQERTFEALKSWSKPCHIIFSDSDIVFTKTWGKQWSALIPGATFDTVRGQHYPQENSPRQMVALMLKYLGKSPASQPD